MECLRLIFLFISLFVPLVVLLTYFYLLFFFFIFVLYYCFATLEFEFIVFLSKSKCLILSSKNIIIDNFFFLFRHKFYWVALQPTVPKEIVFTHFLYKKSSVRDTEIRTREGNTFWWTATYFFFRFHQFHSTSLLRRTRQAGLRFSYFMSSLESSPCNLLPTDMYLIIVICWWEHYYPY